MKKKLSLLLVVVMALTMMLGTGVCAWADVFVKPDSGVSEDFPDSDPLPAHTDTCVNSRVNHFYFTGHTYNYSYGGTTDVYAEGIWYKYTDGTLSFWKCCKEGMSNGYLVVSYFQSGPGWYRMSGEDSWCKCEAPGPDPNPDSTCASSSAHVHEWTEGIIYDATETTDGLEGTYCKTCGAIKESTPISAYAYSLNKVATDKINAAKPGQTITFEFGEWNSFPKNFMEKLVAKSAQGVTFVFHYKWNHVKQEITIPAGTPIDLNFDYYGPAKMAELYGMY